MPIIRDVFLLNLIFFVRRNDNISESGMRLACDYLSRLIHLKKFGLAIKYGRYIYQKSEIIKKNSYYIFWIN